MPLTPATISFMDAQYIKILKSTAYRKWLGYNFYGENQRLQIMGLKKIHDITLCDTSTLSDIVPAPVFFYVFI